MSWIWKAEVATDGVIFLQKDLFLFKQTARIGAEHLNPIKKWGDPRLGFSFCKVWSISICPHSRNLSFSVLNWNSGCLLALDSSFCLSDIMRLQILLQIYAGQLLFSPFLVLLCLHNICFHVSQSRIFSKGNISKHILTLLSDNRPIPYMLLRMTAKALREYKNYALHLSLE